MNDTRYLQNVQLVPLISPVDGGAAAAGATPFVKMTNANRVAFHLAFGTITGDSVTITVEAATVGASGSEIAVPFTYRLSGAVGSDTWSAVTTADSAGIDIAATDDDKILWVDYDPRSNADYDYVRLVYTSGSSVSAVELQCSAFLEPKYGQLDIPSST